MQKEFSSPSPQTTQKIAKDFAKAIPQDQSQLITLEGDLGAGKTCFAKGFIHAKTQTPPDEITSPTFTLIEEYKTKDGRKIYHVDLYRAESEKDLETLDWRELYEGGNILLVEWPERLPELRRRCDYAIRFLKESPDGRRILVEPQAKEF